MCRSSARDSVPVSSSTGVILQVNAVNLQNLDDACNRSRTPRWFKFAAGLRLHLMRVGVVNVTRKACHSEARAISSVAENPAYEIPRLRARNDT